MSENKTKTNDIQRDWYFFDAKGRHLGRLATEIAVALRGKNKVNFLPNLDQGGYVVVVNAGKFVLTGKKTEQKRYYTHSGYLGNLKTYTVSDLLTSKPDEIIKKAVYGMLPANKLRPKFMARLKLYTSTDHPHNNAKFVNAEEGK